MNLSLARKWRCAENSFIIWISSFFVVNSSTQIFWQFFSFLPLFNYYLKRNCVVMDSSSVFFFLFGGVKFYIAWKLNNNMQWINILRHVACRFQIWFEISIKVVKIELIKIVRFVVFLGFFFGVLFVVWRDANQKLKLKQQKSSINTHFNIKFFDFGI